MKKKNRNAIISLITVILLTFITSCSKANGVLPDLEITDGGLISGIPCSAPCFWDILPGITTESEAIEILSTLGSINNCEKWEKVENGADRGLRCKNVGLTFDENDYVNQLSFSPDIPITVDELFAKYGEPDYADVTAYGINLEGPLTMILLYNNEQMTIGFDTQDSQYFDIQPTTIIKNITYCSPASYSGFINSLSVPWEGFGKY